MASARRNVSAGARDTDGRFPNPFLSSRPSMSIETGQPTARREFLGQIAASAIVLAGTACAGPAAATQAAPAPAPARNPDASPPPPTHWDDSWFTRLTAKHKAVFDSPEVEDGLAIEHAVL